MYINYKDDPLKYYGEKKKDNYFEGWYFKHVSSDLKNIISVIPGISKNLNDPHSFIQTIIYTENNGKKSLTTNYHRFSYKDFKYRKDPFSLQIDRNIFKREVMILDLFGEYYTLQGRVKYTDFTDIKRNICSPNAMGYFAYIPNMECYHDIVSMNHSLKGSLYLNYKLVDFNKGKGYIEKDWGTSFPKDYIWIQSNNFEVSDASIMCSIAHIPFLNTFFRGFICNFIFNGKEFRFATYNRSKITKEKVIDNKVEITIEKDNLKLEIKAEISNRGKLKAPKNGVMDIVIKEGLSGLIDVRLSRKSEILFQGHGNPCSIEVVV
ncbi:tocopherol cyclase family protein [Tissierella sp. Yu-01]|uniref:tocopherol cyclase family protein n=1 Tax=Tissierella sp. Yu-01 TaxID=3035694 RepID=UPI00240D9416|nr:tocopherol cyclase family protein [Tissierella sp. Yu-01]WFA10047.1 tocopherol cyclase family protein [Tissierella sp. Yu-01]